MSSDNPDFSPFMNLNRDVELAILKQLEFRDYLNLALTCRKWYNIASTAPRSFQPILKFDRLVSIFYRLGAEHKIEGANHSAYYRDDNEFPLSVNNKFELVNVIQCDNLIIDHDFLREEFDPVVEYIVKNRDHFHFDKMKWTFQREGFPNEQLLGHVFNLSSCRSIKFLDYSGNFHSMKNECIRKIVEENRTLEKIECYIRLPKSVITTVLKQVINGDRPNLRYFECDYQRDNDFTDEFEDEEDFELEDEEDFELEDEEDLELEESLIKDFIHLEFPNNLKSEEQENGPTFIFVLITSDSREMTIVDFPYAREMHFYFKGASK